MATPVVVKFGGSVFTPDALAPFARAIAKLAKTRSVVVVHGGGKAITQALDERGIPSMFVDGLRVTDTKALEVVEEVLSGRVNKAVVRSLAEAGVPSIGISGTDSQLLQATVLQKIVVHADGQQEAVDWGRVGDVATVDATVLRHLAAGGYVTVVSPVGLGPDGQPLNINADTAAAAIAGALHAELRMLTDVAGVLTTHGDLLEEATAPQAQDLKAQGVVTGGMLPKLDACLDALRSGSPAAIIQGLDAFLAGTSRGTRLVRPQAA